MLLLAKKKTNRMTPKQKFGIGLVSLFGFSVAVKSGLLRSWDRALTGWALEQHTPVLDQWMQSVTFLGSSTLFLIALFLLSIYWLRAQKIDRIQCFVGFWLFGLGIQWILRLSVAQWRPETGMLPDPLSFWQRYDLAGYTTGHGFRAAFLFGWFYRESLKVKTAWSKYGAALSVLAIVAVGITRIYLQRHWMSDVLGAWILAFMVFSGLSWFEMKSSKAE